MTFSASPAVFQKFPALAIGIVIAQGIENTGSHPEIAEMLRVEERKIRSSFSLETFRDHPNLSSLQAVHRSFGNNPNKFPPSIQSLIKRILKGGDLPSINPVVDIYNVISLRHVLCAGAEDTDACKGDILLDEANGSEAFVPLGETANDPPSAGELVYKDAAGVICRKLNWRECDRTKITERTKNAVIVLEGFPPVTQQDLSTALMELAELMRKFCSAETRNEILTKDQISSDIL